MPAPPQWGVLQASCFLQCLLQSCCLQSSLGFPGLASKLLLRPTNSLGRTTSAPPSCAPPKAGGYYRAGLHALHLHVLGIQHRAWCLAAAQEMSNKAPDQILAPLRSHCQHTWPRRFKVG